MTTCGNLRNLGSVLKRKHPSVEDSEFQSESSFLQYKDAGARPLVNLSHSNQTSSWIPPPSNWDLPGSQAGMPYGWEVATDKDGKDYYINHLTKTTTYDDPRRESQDDSPRPREVVLTRHQEYGFGFVAGSEKPVIVRFVTEGGPSEDKLLAADQIWFINGEDVRKAPREHVIQLVRSCKETVHLTVCQPPLDNSSRKSALLSAAKKAKLKCNPSRVRFAEGVVINGSPLFTNARFGTNPEGTIANGSVGGESCVPLMPNVLKVFLENGQTKSFKYDGCTTVHDVLESLQQKLTVRCLQHFALVVEHVKSLRRNKLTLLDPEDALCKIASQPGAHHLRCLFRVTFVPKDACELLRKDPVAFEYLYMQCCNDVVHERFAPELKYDIALRLAALHIHQHALANNMSGKLSIKAIEKEFGLERFVPSSLAETMKRKELRKLLQHFLKSNSGLVPAGQKSLTALQAKLHYLRIIGELPSYGAKCFATNLRQDSSTECVLLVSPKFGISQISGIRNSVPFPVCDIESVISVEVIREDELSCRVEIKLKDPERENFVVSLEERDADELILVLKGYYFLLTGQHLVVHKEEDQTPQGDLAPPYHGQHQVQPATWSYVPSLLRGDDDNCSQVIDLTLPPPYNPAIASDPLYAQRGPSSSSLIPNGHVGSNIHHNFDSLPASPTKMAVQLGPSDKPCIVDRNMNKTSASNLNVSESITRSPQVSRHSILNGPTSINDYPNVNFAVNSPVRSPRLSSKQITFEGMNSSSHKLGFDLQSVVSMEILESNDNDRSSTQEFRRKPNDERALKRVAEMKQLVEDAENYLTDHESADTLSLRSSLSQTDSDVSSSTAAAHSAAQAAVGQLKHSDSLLLLSQDAGDTQLTEAVNIAVEHIRAMTMGETEPSESDTDSICTPTESPSRRPIIRPMLKTSDSSFGLHSPDTFPNGTYRGQDFQEILRKLQEEHSLPYNFAEGTLYLDPDIIDLTMIPPPITPEEEGFKQLPNPLSTPPTPFADRMTLEAELKAMDIHSDNFQQLWLQQFDDRTDTPSTLQNLDSDSIGIGYHSDDSENSLVDSLPLDRRSRPVWKYQDIDSFISMTTLPPPPDTTADGIPCRTAEVTEYISNLIIPPPPSSSASVDTAAPLGRAEQLKSPTESKISPKIALLQSQLKKTNLNDPADTAVPGNTSYNNAKCNDKAYHEDNDIARPVVAADVDPSQISIAQRRAIFLGVTSAKESNGLGKDMKQKMGSTKTESYNSRPQAFPDNVIGKSSSQNDLLENNCGITMHTERESISLSTSEETLSNSFPMGLMGTSSDDSLDSTASYATVKSVDTTDLPPALPPKSPPMSGTDARLAKPPVVPSRLKKPMSPDVAPNPMLEGPVTVYVGGCPGVQMTENSKVSVMSNNIMSNGVTDGFSVKNNLSCSPKLVRGYNGSKANEDKERMLHTASPLATRKNGYVLNGILHRTESASTAESSNYDNDSLDGSPDLRHISHVASNKYRFPMEGKQAVIAYGTIDDLLGNVVQRLEDIIGQCGAAHVAGGGIYMNDEKFQASKEALATQARQLVTASKLFVKSVTEDCTITVNGTKKPSPAEVKERLENCVTLLEKMTEISEDVVHYTSTPLQTQNLLVRVRAVAHAFRLSVQAAAQIIERKPTDDYDTLMAPLMERATLLAADLSALLRTLRVFAP
ncbi:unnamed protein product [Allacma fusca]|uniref:FERM and PDZ domain-containing protein 4 n=1 Tax=Allacma fusca TaxID=39272 RepID=A0A8J2L499_9HEXA|nr:unnamed protein product [Allacma fusca]